MAPTILPAARDGRFWMQINGAPGAVPRCRRGCGTSQEQLPASVGAVHDSSQTATKSLPTSFACPPPVGALAQMVGRSSASSEIWRRGSRGDAACGACRSTRYPVSIAWSPTTRAGSESLRLPRRNDTGIATTPPRSASGSASGPGRRRHSLRDANRATEVVVTDTAARTSGILTMSSRQVTRDGVCPVALLRCWCGLLRSDRRPSSVRLT